MHNPLIDASPEYNVTKFIFLENYNYYLGSVVKLSLKHVDKDPVFCNITRTLTSSSGK